MLKVITDLQGNVYLDEDGKALLIDTQEESGSGGGSVTAQEIMDATNNVNAILKSTENEPIPDDSIVIAQSILKLEDILGE